MSTQPQTGALGERKLSTIHAVAQALAIGPMFSIAIVESSISRPDIGASWNATLAVLVASLGVMAIGYVVALFARRFAGAGAVYEYLTRGAHPSVGIFASGLYFVGTLFLGGGGIFLGLGILINQFWTAHISATGAPDWWILALIMLVFVLALNYLGVRIAIRAMLAFAAIALVPMLILGIVIVAKGGHGGNTLTMFDPGQTSLFGVAGGGVLGGVLLGILLFVGFEAAASIGEESHDPHRSIPRAVLWTVAAAGALFTFMAYAFSIGYGHAAVVKGAWAFDPASVDTMGTRYVGSWFATILDVIVILDATALALAICVTIGRGYFALGRDGLLPKVFAKTSRFDTPWVGNLMVAVGGVGLILLSTGAHYGTLFGSVTGGKFVPSFPNDEFATFIMAATVGSFAVELVYLMLGAGALWLLYKTNGKPWQYLVAVIAIATPVLGFYGALHPAPHNTSNYNYIALYFTFGVIALSALWFVVCRLVYPQRVANAATHASEHRGVPPLDEAVDFTAT
ncbi:MAG TPA: APC family permease [Solirubrobacteraceae bacterium]|nr:APC family permease [Solirubrobacteraceae bacterium]